MITWGNCKNSNSHLWAWLSQTQKYVGPSHMLIPPIYPHLSEELKYSNLNRKHYHWPYSYQLWPPFHSQGIPGNSWNQSLWSCAKCYFYHGASAIPVGLWFLVGIIRNMTYLLLLTMWLSDVTRVYRAGWKLSIGEVQTAYLLNIVNSDLISCSVNMWWSGNACTNVSSDFWGRVTSQVEYRMSEECWSRCTITTGFWV